MSQLTKVILNSGKEQSPKRFHPWIFSGAIKRIEGDIQNGDVVEVYSSKNEYLATGHYQKGSIAIRIFSFEKIIPDVAFWKQKIEKALNYRNAIGVSATLNNQRSLSGVEMTNVYRLVYGEGDGLTGLIIDYYNGTAVLQAHSIGMHRERHVIAEALQLVYGDKLDAVYDKSKESLGTHEYVNESGNGYLFGSPKNKTVLENGHAFAIDWEEGQKTGFFIDQRENRKLVAEYAAGKSVLDCFCYAGGFSVYALKAGAARVNSVDSSKNAITLTDANINLNQHSGEHTSHVADAFEFLAAHKNEYDLMVIDPPAFAKHRDAKHQALQGYKRLNALAIKGIKPGGLIFTFSCSQVVDKYLFHGAITAAAIEADRNVRIVKYLSQPADHPISIFHPEGEYLKGMMLFAE